MAPDHVMTADQTDIRMCGYIWLAITRDTDHNQTLGQDSGSAIVYEYTNIEIAVTSPLPHQSFFLPYFKPYFRIKKSYKS